MSYPAGITAKNDLLSGVGFPEVGNSNNNFWSRINEKYYNKEAQDRTKDISGKTDRSNNNINNPDK
jgi:hypothetical protein